MSEEGLQRAKWSSKLHRCGDMGEDAMSGGQVMSVYIYFNQKWLKIGEYCRRCGTFLIFQKFEKGVPRDLMMALKRW